MTKFGNISIGKGDWVEVETEAEIDSRTEQKSATIRIGWVRVRLGKPIQPIPTI